MSRLIITELGASQFMTTMLGMTRPENLWLRLYINPHMPMRTDLPHNFTEAGGHGYSPKLITPEMWTMVRLEHNLIGVMTIEPLLWTFEDGPVPQRIYGSYAMGATRGLLYWGDPLDEPVVVERRGQQLAIQPCLVRALAPDPMGG